MNVQHNTYAINKNEQCVIASKTSKEEAPFRCLLCKDPLILRAGLKNKHHFALCPIVHVEAVMVGVVSLRNTVRQSAWLPTTYIEYKSSSPVPTKDVFTRVTYGRSVSLEKIISQ